ncbi:hypothetical protein [Spirosoma jeollabukense]
MESKLKHLEFIQIIINRLNSNGFLIKGWAITLVAALFALAAKDANEQFILITYLSTLVFWLLDAYYLSQERQYRCLYNQVIQLDNETIDFSMNARPFANGRNTWPASFFATTLLVFYGSLLCLPIVIIVAMMHIF